MISKELLSEVLGEDIKSYEAEGSEIICETLDYFSKRGTFDINIHELAHRCEEYVYSNDYHIETSANKLGNYLKVYKMYKEQSRYVIDKSSGRQFDNNGYITDLFKATQWIYDNKDKQ
jgi:hypothetical protein